ncbi:MAG: endonuclease V [Planctomycetota bacterium]
MKVRRLHRWDLSPRAAIRLQERLRRRLVLRGGPRAPRWIAAADASFDDRFVYGVAVLWDATRGETVEVRSARRPLTFPYVPGLLSFREAPTLLDAFRKLSRRPDLVLADGQGIAHPRGFGVACHLGLLLDVPTIGVAKSLLVGDHHALPRRAGATAALHFRGKQVGWALRSRAGVRPVFVSPGHRVALAVAPRLVRATLRGFRLPEPIRGADSVSKRIRTEAERDVSRSAEGPSAAPITRATRAPVDPRSSADPGRR